MSERKSFVFYNAWAAMLNLMTDKNAGIFTKAIASYALNGVEPKFEDHGMGEAFDFVKQKIDEDREKYESKIKRAADARDKRKQKSNLESELKSTLESNMKSTLESDLESNMKSTLESNMKSMGVTDTVTDTVTVTVTDTDTVTDNVSPKGDKKEPPSGGKKKPKRHKYGEYQHVLLSDRDMELLFDKHGEVMTHRLIKKLDEAIETRGYKYKNHYLVLNGWVLDSIKEEDSKRPKGETNVFDEWRNA